MAYVGSTSRSPRMDDIPLELEERIDSKLNPKHTIFLSHSGAQKAFVEQLYVDLKRRGQSPLFDQSTDSLPKGEVFADRIFEAAKQCVVAVVVLSSEFLESKWAMQELATFVEAQKTLNPKLKLLPLFYKLEAADLRTETSTRMTLWTKMADADAHRIHLDVWKNAVEVLARANGEVFSKYGGSEVKYRAAIVDAVCQLCRRYVLESRVPSMLGRDRLCKIMEGEFEKLAAKIGIPGTRILGLYGMRGMGKTLICKALCDHFSDEYSERVCYVEYSDGSYLELLKLILEELTDIDEKALQKIRSEKQANESLKQFLPKQDVFLALDNLQDDHLDWPILKYLSAKSKVVVTSRSAVDVQRVVGSHGSCLPCPTLTESDAVKLFVRSAGCSQPPAKWTNEEMEILEKCVGLSFFKNDFDSMLDSHSSEELHGPHVDPLVQLEAFETDEEMENFKKCIELSLFKNDSDSLLNSDSSEKHGHHNPLVLVAMGTSIKEGYALKPMQLVKKCQSIKFLRRHEGRKLSDVLRTGYKALTADEKSLFLDVALFYPIMNLGDVEFVDMLDRLLKWLETVDGSPRREILHKLEKLKDLNVLAFNDPRKVRVLFPNIYLVLGSEGIMQSNDNSDGHPMRCLNKAIEILTLLDVSPEGMPGDFDLGVQNQHQVHGNHYMFRGMLRKGSMDFKGAVEDLLKANKFYPNHPRIHHLMGSSRVGTDQIPEAFEALNRAIALYPTTEEGILFARENYPDAFAIRGYVKLRLHDLGGAKLDIDFATALDPNSTCTQAFRPIIYRSLGLIG